MQQAAKGESHVRESEGARGQHPAQSPGLGHVERLRERILREAEETFAREVKKMTDAGDSASFTSVPSAKAEGQQEPVGEPTKLGGPPDTPGSWSCSSTRSSRSWKWSDWGGERDEAAGISDSCTA